eukprot:gene6854-7625_t
MLRNTTESPGSRRRNTKVVQFNTALNVYIEPLKRQSEDTATSWETAKENATKRRNAVSIMKKDSIDVLRFLSLHNAYYRTWSPSRCYSGDGKATGNREKFAEFLMRTAPNLHVKFYLESKKLS